MELGGKQVTDLLDAAGLLAQSVTVSEINLHIKRILDSHDEIQGVWVRGEIADLHHHVQSGHVYFCLKDAESRLKCVMFKRDASLVPFELHDGLSVVVYGDISVYTRGGTYQLYAREMISLGDGSLAGSFELVRQRLAQDGLLDASRKRSLPKFPKKIALITSPEGAAVKDVLAVLKRRYPIVEVVVVPCTVQGEDAVSSIVSALAAAATDPSFDVGILTRGGGPADDLWVFNNEAIARQLAAMPFPMVCAVGHERDFTICDLVADLRAPTPSAAAELVAPDRSSLFDHISHLESRAKRSLVGLMDISRSRIAGLESTWVLRRPDMIFASLRQALEELLHRLDVALGDIVKPRAAKLDLLMSRLDACSPFKTLNRGYALVTNTSNGQLVVSTGDVEPGDEISVRVSNGEFLARVSDAGGDSERGSRQSGP